ncbi:NAD(P)-dependent oxidoreductase [Pseudoruegeria sp. SHC-113]|uniref:NAD(P)-dependent oxidoreductase n=1 Tax=Pseudoruegeria sp. SHC-113 TaxID=2855439 RepID=UPI0021BB61D9|nr:NAD(P)-dependent oxidoreductase [Pseudoruegeria sp. SHC-113]MCT8161594.1 NAD(P)-dependent oxidoreductase [Pseudoruegeria sp. SHC-113]
MTKPTIALLGTGLMGAPMAANLCRAGYPLRVWNRTRTKAEPLAAQGAQVCDSAAEAVAGVDIVISMMADGPTTAAVQAEPDLRAGLKAGALWIEMASVKPEEARAQAADLAKLGLRHLDAPVSGGTKGAEGAKLAIMVGGEAEVFAEAEPVLSAMGRPVHVGPSGSGELSKLANQSIVAITIAAVAEAMLLLEKGGANPAAVRDALKGGFADSTILQQHGQRMTEGNFVPGGLTKFQVKDLDNVLAEAAGLGLTLPTTHDVNERFRHLCDAMDGGDMDHSALYLELKQRNGLV